MAVEKLVIGEKIADSFFLLDTITSVTDKEGNVTYYLVLSDKTGEVKATCRQDLITDAILANVKGVVKVSAVVRPGKERKPELTIKEISKAKPGEYKSSEIFDGLSEEKIAEYKSIINGLKRFIKHAGYKALVEIALNEDNLNKLASMPATLGYYGKYKGGALAGAALVSLIAKDCSVDYVKHFNALHTSNFDWSLLLTASLLNTYGVIDFLTPSEPFRKTANGVERGYFSSLQSRIEKIVYTNSLEITEDELSKLLNVLAASMSKRTDVRATSKEGIMLRHCVALYSELDMLDYGVEQDKTEDADEIGYFYNTTLRRYVAS